MDEYPAVVVRVEDMEPTELAYAEALHEDCDDGPPHPLADHSPWSGGDLDGTEPWSAFGDRLMRHGLIIVSRQELIDAFTFWMIEAEHHDFRPIQPTPEEYGVQAADHLLRLLHLERTG